MANNKNNPNAGSESSMSNKTNQEFASKGKNEKFDNQGQRTNDPGKSAGSPGMIDDETVDTAGGRKGQFSDKERGSQAKWSPGSGDSHSE
jgi:hypothetical protein